MAAGGMQEAKAVTTLDATGMAETALEEAVDLLVEIDVDPDVGEG